MKDLTFPLAFLLLYFSCASSPVSAFLTGSTSTAFPVSTGSKKYGRIGEMKMENFGLDFGEDPTENTPPAILGEARYKKFVGSYKENALLLGGSPNAPNVPDYDVIDRVSETKLLSLTAESGLLSALEEKGLTLSDLEKLLPLIDELNLLPFAVENKRLILNTIAPLVIEQSSVAIPLAVSVLKTNPSVFFTMAAGAVGAETAITLLSHNTVADIAGALVLLPVAAVTFTVGNVLKSGVNVNAIASTAKSIAAPPSPKQTSSTVKRISFGSFGKTNSDENQSFSRPSISMPTIATKAKASSRPTVAMSAPKTAFATPPDFDNSPVKKVAAPKKALNFKARKPAPAGKSNWTTGNKE